jgi:hypothetical protein
MKVPFILSFPNYKCGRANFKGEKTLPDERATGRFPPSPPAELPPPSAGKEKEDH